MLKILPPHGGADHRLLDNRHRGGERARADQQRQVHGLALGEAGDDELPAEGRIDAGVADQAAVLEELDRLDLLAVLIDDEIGARARLDEQDVHHPPHIVPGDAVDLVAALGVEADLHLGQAVLVERGAHIADAVALEDHVVVDIDREGAFRGDVIVGLIARPGRAGRRLEMEFKRGDALEDADRLGRVLHAGQFDDDAVGALLLHRGLGDAEGVDAVEQGGAVGLERVALDLQHRVLGHAQVENVEIVGLAVLELQFGEVVEQFRAGPGAVVGAGETDFDMGAVNEGEPPGADAKFAQDAAHIAEIVFHAAEHGGFHIDFHQEMHAALQVEAEVHLAGADGLHPARRGRREVERDDEVVAQGILDGGLGPQLFVNAVEAQQDATAVEFLADGGEPGGFESRGDPVEVGLAKLAALVGDLQGFIVGVQIGHRIENAEHHDQQDQQVFPSRVVVQHWPGSALASGARIISAPGCLWAGRRRPRFFAV